MNSNINPDGENKRIEAENEKKDFLEKNRDNINIAEEIYDNNIMKSGNKISKAIIAQILADEIEGQYNKDRERFKELLEDDDSIKYLIDAIKFVGEENDSNR